MRYIVIPETVQHVGAELPSFAKFVDDTLLNHPSFGADLASVRASARLGIEVRGYVVPGGVWSVDEDSWKRLKRACEEPGIQWNPIIARAMLPYFDAIVGAGETERRPS